MVMGVTLVKAVPGQEKLIYSSLKSRDEVLNVYHMFGEYAFFVMLQTDNIGRLNQAIERIKEMHGVIIARTMLIKRNSVLQEHKPVKALA